MIIEPNNDVPDYCFRSCSPKMELEQSSKIAIYFSGNQFDSFTESEFVFDRGIDCVCRGDGLIEISHAERNHEWAGSAQKKQVRFRQSSRLESFLQHIKP